MSEWLTTWAHDNATLLTLVSIASIALLCLTVFLTPWLVAQLPTNYFSEEPIAVKAHPVRALVVKVGRNLIGSLIVLAGLLMILLPGPGLITLVVGLSLCDFKAKKRLIRRIVDRPAVIDSLNWMRRRHNKAPLIPPGQA